MYKTPSRKRSNSESISIPKLPRTNKMRRSASDEKVGKGQKGGISPTADAIRKRESTIVQQFKRPILPPN